MEVFTPWPSSLTTKLSAASTWEVAQMAAKLHTAAEPSVPPAILAARAAGICAREHAHRPSMSLWDRCVRVEDKMDMASRAFPAGI